MDGRSEWLTGDKAERVPLHGRLSAFGLRMGGEEECEGGQLFICRRGWSVGARGPLVGRERDGALAHSKQGFGQGDGETSKERLRLSLMLITTLNGPRATTGDYLV